jgi:DNA repair exonuclease SbcCD ATPase subunit
MKKIEKIEFKNFRAYKNHTFDIDPSKNIVLIYGNNGFGKTSFFDGIEWGLTGKLERYSGAAKEKNEYPILKNNFTTRTESGHINILLSDGSNIKREIKTSGNSDYNEGKLNINIESYNNIMLKDTFKDKVIFNDNFNFSHLLSQELLNSFIRGTKDTDRYKAIVRLFGLERYEKFNPHIKVMVDKIVLRLNDINDNLRKITNRIELEKVKSSNLDINPSIKIKELRVILESLGLKIESEFNNEDLENISKDIQQKKLEIEKGISNINRAIADFVYFDNNHITNEEKNKHLMEKKKSIEESIKNISLLEYYDTLDYIKNNLIKYNDYLLNKTQYDNIKTQYEEFKFRISNNPLFTNTQFDLHLKYIEVLDVKYKSIVEEYRLNRQSLCDAEQKKIGLEKQLSEKFGLEKKLLKTAQDFLIENLNLDQCPVCQNDFNLTETLRQLENRLMAEYSPLFKGLIDEIEENKMIINAKMTSIDKLESQLKEVIASVKTSILNKKEEYEEHIKQINEKNQVVNTVLSKAALYKLSTDKDLINNEYTKTREIILGKKLNSDIKYYQLLKVELEKSITQIEADLRKYSNIKEHYKITTITASRQLLETNKKEQTALTELIEKYEKVILIANELLEYMKSLSSKEIIDKLIIERNTLETESIALNNIKVEYDRILRSVRTVIEDETKNTLNKYLDNIRRIYSYLNPHLYLRSFDVKIDGTNPSNNRLVFEVFNENNSKVNPSYIFSSAQNNVLALSIYLSFAFFQDWSNLNFICLDDPIQNMDDINVFNFVDIIRALIKETDKQIYISTHDDRVYNFMLKKFRGDVQAFRFTEYGKAIKE